VHEQIVPFRAEHVGSLLRPPELLQARTEHHAGRRSAAELCHIEDAAVRDAVLMQQEIGRQGVTDGEFRRGPWHMDFRQQIAGVTRADGAQRERQTQMKKTFFESGNVYLAAAASVRRERNQDWAWSAAARRCQAIDTVVAKSIGSGVIEIAAFAAICSATRRGTVAIRSEAASAAGTAR
jgi:methionine synthase II (cobalamin-independent)